MRIAAAIAALLIAGPIRAQPDGGDVAAAEAYFEEGMKLMAAGKYAEACPKLAESLRLDRGVGTLFNLARCYEQIGRLASAWGRYREASQEAERRGQLRRARVAGRFADRLEPRLHRLVILVPKKSRVEGLAIERGGVPVGPGGWGDAVPVDPGELVISATAPGHRPWQTAVTIGGDERLAVVKIPPLEPAPAQKAAPVPPVFDVERVPGEPWYRDTAGWGLVAGAVALAGGATFAWIRAESLESEARDEGDLGPRDRLFDESDNYRTASVVLLGAAAVAGAAGAIRLALAPPDTVRKVRRAALLVGPRSIAVRLRF